MSLEEVYPVTITPCQAGNTANSFKGLTNQVHSEW